MNSSATCRLNAVLCDRCFVMTSILRKPGQEDQFKSPVLSHRRGALQSGVPFAFRLTSYLVLAVLHRDPVTVGYARTSSPSVALVAILADRSS